MSKPQDGLVSRFLNRPISRFVTTRWLLKTSIQPNTWTIAICIFPIIAAVCFAFGGYVPVVIGAALFQVYSILDGCDGELARAKELESPSGERLDYLCDFVGSLFYVIALGFGLARFQEPYDPKPFLEGFVCAALITINELLLCVIKNRSVPATALHSTLYERHRGMVEHSGLRLLGDKPAQWLMQLTKRDVAIFVFLLLAILNRSHWILHLWTAVAALSVIASSIAAIKSNIRPRWR